MKKPLKDVSRWALGLLLAVGAGALASAYTPLDPVPESDLPEFTEWGEVFEGDYLTEAGRKIWQFNPSSNGVLTVYVAGSEDVLGENFVFSGYDSSDYTTGTALFRFNDPVLTDGFYNCEFNLTGGATYYLATNQGYSNYAATAVKFEWAGSGEEIKPQGLSSIYPAAGITFDYSTYQDITVSATAGITSFSQATFSYNSVYDVLSSDLAKLNGPPTNQFIQIGGASTNFSSYLDAAAKAGASSFTITITDVMAGGAKLSYSDITSDYVSVNDGTVTITYNLEVAPQLESAEWPDYFYSDWATSGESSTVTLNFNTDIASVGSVTVYNGNWTPGATGGGEDVNTPVSQKISATVDGSTVTFDLADATYPEGVSQVSVWVENVTTTGGTTLVFNYGTVYVYNLSCQNNSTEEPEPEIPSDGSYSLSINGTELSTSADDLTEVETGFNSITVTGDVELGPNDEWNNSPTAFIKIYGVNDQDQMTVAGVDTYSNGELKLWDPFEVVGDYVIEIPEGTFVANGEPVAAKSFYFTTGTAEVIPTTLYIRGAFNEYSEPGDTQWQLAETEEGSNVFEGTFEVPAEQFEFNLITNEGMLYVFEGDGVPPSNVGEGEEDRPGLMYKVVDLTSGSWNGQMSMGIAGDQNYYWYAQNWNGGEITVTADLSNLTITITGQENGGGDEPVEADYSLSINGTELSTSADDLTEVETGFNSITVTGDVELGPNDEWNNSPTAFIKIYGVNDQDQMTVAGVDTYSNGELKLWDPFEVVGDYVIEIPEGTFVANGQPIAAKSFYFTTGVAEVIPTTLYIRGAFNEYSEPGDSQWQLAETEEGSNVFEGTFEVPAEQFEFNLITNEGMLYVFEGDGVPPSNVGEGEEDRPGLMYKVVDLTSGSWKGQMSMGIAGDQNYYWYAQNWNGGEITVTADLNEMTITITGQENSAEQYIENGELQNADQLQVGNAVLLIDWSQSVSIPEENDDVEVPVLFNGEPVSSLTSMYISMMGAGAGEPGIDAAALTPIMQIVLTDVVNENGAGDYTIQLPKNYVVNDEGIGNAEWNIEVTVTEPSYIEGTLSPESESEFTQGEEVVFTITFEEAIQNQFSEDAPVIVTNYNDFEETYAWNNGVSISDNTVTINLGSELAPGTYYLTFREGAVSTIEDGMVNAMIEASFTVVEGGGEEGNPYTIRPVGSRSIGTQYGADGTESNTLYTNNAWSGYGFTGNFYVVAKWVSQATNLTFQTYNNTGNMSWADAGQTATGYAFTNAFEVLHNSSITGECYLIANNGAKIKSLSFTSHVGNSDDNASWTINGNTYSVPNTAEGATITISDLNAEQINFLPSFSNNNNNCLTIENFSVELVGGLEGEPEPEPEPEPGDTYDINDVIGTYTAEYEDWYYTPYTIEGVIINLDGSDYGLTITNLFPNLKGYYVTATFNATNNTISIPQQYLKDPNGATSVYIFENENYEGATFSINEGVITMMDEGVYIYDEYDYDNYDIEMYALKLTKTSDSTEEPEPEVKYDINDVIGTYNGVYNEGDDTVNGVIIDLGSTENSLVIKNLFKPASDISVNATFDPTSNTITVKSQSVLYVWDYNTNNWGSSATLTVEEDGTIVLEDNKEFNIYQNGQYLLYMEYLELTKISDSTEEPKYYDINEVIGTYDGVYNEGDDTVNGVIIDLGSTENALVIKNLFKPVSDISVNATFDPTSNTITVKSQSVLYVWDYNTNNWGSSATLTVEEDGTIVLEDNKEFNIYQNGQYLLYMEYLELTKISSSTEEPEPEDKYDINDVIGTYTAAYEDYYYTPYTIDGVIINLDGSDNGLTITNLFPNLKGYYVTATFDATNNTISVPQQYLKDPNGAESVYIFENENYAGATFSINDDVITLKDEAVFIYDVNNYNNYDIEMYDLKLTKTSDSTEEPEPEPTTLAAPTFDPESGSVMDSPGYFSLTWDQPVSVIKNGVFYVSYNGGEKQEVEITEDGTVMDGDNYTITLNFNSLTFDMSTFTFNTGEYEVTIPEGTFYATENEYETSAAYEATYYVMATNNRYESTPEAGEDHTYAASQLADVTVSWEGVSQISKVNNDVNVSLYKLVSKATSLGEDDTYEKVDNFYVNVNLSAGTVSFDLSNVGAGTFEVRFPQGLVNFDEYTTNGDFTLVYVISEGMGTATVLEPTLPAMSMVSKVMLTWDYTTVYPTDTEFSATLTYKQGETDYTVTVPAENFSLVTIQEPGDEDGEPNNDPADQPVPAAEGYGNVLVIDVESLLEGVNGYVTLTIPQGIVADANGKANDAQNVEFRLTPLYDGEANVVYNAADETFTIKWTNAEDLYLSGYTGLAAYIEAENDRYLLVPDQTIYSENWNSVIVEIESLNLGDGNYTLIIPEGYVIVENCLNAEVSYQFNFTDGVFGEGHVSSGNTPGGDDNGDDNNPGGDNGDDNNPGGDNGDDNGGEDGPTSAIAALEAEANQSGVYTLNGMKVGNTLNGLAKGIYIVNGQKVYIGTR